MNDIRKKGISEEVIAVKQQKIHQDDSDGFFL